MFHSDTMFHLEIKVRDGDNNILAGFPFQEDQFVNFTELQDDGTTKISICLYGKEDITAAQAQHLDTNGNVISYDVVEDQ